MAERLGKGIKRYFKDNLGILCALAAMILFLYIWPTTHSTFLTQRNIFNVLRQSAPNLLLACGMTMVIILGGIDLSVGSIIAMSGVLCAAAVVWWGLPEIAGILIGILSGVIFGLFNGAIIAKTQIPPFIVTLASMNIAKGIAYVYSGGKPIRCMTDAWKFLGAGYIGPVPTQVVTMFVVFIIVVMTAMPVLMIVVLVSVVMVMIMVAVFVLVIMHHLGGKLFKLLFQGIFMLHGSKNLLAVDRVPVGRHNGNVGVLAQMSDRLFHLRFIECVREHDTTCMLDLIEEKFPEVFEVHLAFLRVYDGAEGIKLRAYDARLLNGTDDIRELADTRRLDDDAIG